MSNVRLTWDLPSVSVRQLPIDFVRIEFRVDESFEWAFQDNVSSGSVQELLFIDVAPGAFFYRATVVDTAGTEGAPAFTSTAGAAFDAPGQVANFTATEE